VTSDIMVLTGVVLFRSYL